MTPGGEWFFHNIHIIHRKSGGKKVLFSFNGGYGILSANISTDQNRGKCSKEW